MDHQLSAPSPVKETVRRHWDGRARTFDDAPNHGLHSDAQRATWIALIQAWAGPDPIDALDVGCGTGFLALLLAELGHRVVGVDMAGEMLDRARTKAAQAGLTVAFQPADAEDLPFEDGAFDLVLERHVIWTLPEPAVALSEWRRVLRPGGHLVLVEGDWQTAAHADYAAIRASLPLYGGRPATELGALAKASRFIRVTSEPLMGATLWGEAPQRERYALHAWRP